MHELVGLEAHVSARTFASHTSDLQPKRQGQHAVIKMRLFARVLCLEGYDELAAEATESLKRLVEVLGDPGSDEVHDISEATGEEKDGEEKEEEEGH